MGISHIVRIYCSIIFQKTSAIILYQWQELSEISVIYLEHGIKENDHPKGFFSTKLLSFAKIYQ